MNVNNWLTAPTYTYVLVYVVIEFPLKFVWSMFLSNWQKVILVNRPKTSKNLRHSSLKEVLKQRRPKTLLKVLLNGKTEPISSSVKSHVSSVFDKVSGGAEPGSWGGVEFILPSTNFHIFSLVSLSRDFISRRNEIARAFFMIISSPATYCRIV